MCIVSITDRVADIEFYNELRRFILKKCKVNSNGPWTMAIEMGCWTEEEAYARFWSFYDQFRLSFDRRRGADKKTQI